MTIFFDTTEFIKDPLIYDNSMKILFELSKEKEIKIYISEMVLYELKRNHRKQLQEELGYYNERLEKLYIFIDNKYEDKKKKYTVYEIESIFDKRKMELVKNGSFKIAKFDHQNIINSLIKRYVKFKAPFHEDKKGWKDYIIWESYRKIINKKKDKEYIFISNNASEFYDENFNDKDRHYNIHEDFNKDLKCKNIKCYEYIESFIYNNEEYQNIYKKYLIKKYKKYNNKSILEKLFLFTAEIIDKYLYKPDNSYSIKKINTPDNFDIRTNGIKDTINIKITIRYDNKGVNVNKEKTGRDKGNEEKEYNQKQKNYNKNRDNKKQKNNNEEKIISAKCDYTFNLQKFEFNIISIDKFAKEEEIKTYNYNTN